MCPGWRRLREARGDGAVRAHEGVAVLEEQVGEVRADQQGVDSYVSRATSSPDVRDPARGAAAGALAPLQ